MGYTQYMNESWVPEISTSESESSTVGFNVGRLTVPVGYQPVGAQLSEMIARSSFDVTIVRYPSIHADLAFGLQHPDLVSWQADTLMYFETDRHLEAKSHSKVELNRLEVDSAKSLSQIVEDIFHGYTNHYAASPLFEGVNIGRAYSDWAMKSVGQPNRSVYSASRGVDAVVGITVVDTSTVDYDEVLLAGITPDARRAGNYTSMLSLVINESVKSGKRVVISTQVSNVGVIRAWVKLGMLPVLALNTLHVVKRSTLDTYVSSQVK